MSSQQLESIFPRLAQKGYRVTSPEDRDNNCIAWAAGDKRHWWEPILLETHYYWPEGVSREYTLDAYAGVFEALGYETCEDGSVEAGLEKVALFAVEGFPTHAARQLENGRWTSKLGDLEDIEHTLEGLADCLYGEVVRFVKRRRTASADS